MKNYLIMLLSLFVLGCNNNKKVEKIEKVESDPVTVQLTVVNNTGKPLPTIATWGVDAKNVKYTFASINDIRTRSMLIVVDCRFLGYSNACLYVSLLNN